MTTRCKNAIALSLVLLLTLASGCATHSSRTVTRETTEYSEDRRLADPVVERRTETTRTTRVERDPEESSGGVVSGTVNAVGEIIALPFRAVGGLIRAIF